MGFGIIKGINGAGGDVVGKGGVLLEVQWNDVHFVSSTFLTISSAHGSFGIREE